jgi:hypothetical protein
MNEFKGTPGPWRAGSKHPILGQVQATDIFTDEDFGDLIASCSTSPSNPASEANALMMAGSWDLFMALIRLLGKCYKQNWNDNYPDELAQAEAAIAKALGETT